MTGCDSDRPITLALGTPQRGQTISRGCRLLMLLSLPCLRRSPPAFGRFPVAAGGCAARGGAAGKAPLEAPRAGGGALLTRSSAVFGVDWPPGAGARRDGVAVPSEGCPYCYQSCRSAHSHPFSRWMWPVIGPEVAITGSSGYRRDSRQAGRGRRNERRRRRRVDWADAAWHQHLPVSGRSLRLLRPRRPLHPASPRAARAPSQDRGPG